MAALRDSLGPAPELTIAAVERDFFDATEGSQAGIRSDGVPVLLLTLTPAGFKMLLDAVRHWQDHNCPIAPEVGLYLLHLAAATLQPVLDEMPDDIKNFKPFGH